MWVQKKPKGMNLYCTLYLRLFELFVTYNAMNLLINVTTALTTNVEIGLQFEKKQHHVHSRQTGVRACFGTF